MHESPGHHLLSIYVIPSCFGSEQTRQLADRVRSWEIPALRVQVCDLSEPGTARPDRVIAVPAYVLDGQVISLGTPDETWLYDLLSSLG
jgi:hypothetical protein